MTSDVLMRIRKRKDIMFMDLLELIILMCVKQLPAILHEVTPIIQAVLNYLLKKRR